MSMPAIRQMAAADGTALHVIDWPGTQRGGVRRGVQILHGIGEHSGRYAHVARFFNELGFDVRMHDHRGHGRSGGARGDIPDNEAIVRDAALVMTDFAQRFDTPPLLVGHSMGGLFAARITTAGMVPISGLILSSPALAIPLSGPQKLLLRTLASYAPGLAVPNGLQTRHLSHDPATIDAYCKDPLVHGKITARLLRGMLAAVEFAHAHAPSLAVPTLLVVAGDDKLVDARGSDAFFARLQPGIGAIRHYPGFYHELFNELGAADVFADIRAWLQAHDLTAEPQLLRAQT